MAARRRTTSTTRKRTTGTRKTPTRRRRTTKKKSDGWTLPIILALMFFGSAWVGFVWYIDTFVVPNLDNKTAYNQKKL